MAMLNHIWAAIILTGLLVAGLLGRYTGDQGVIPAALDMAKSAVMNIALPLAGMMMFWLGIMRLMEKAGLLAWVSKALAPLMRRLFPEVPSGHPALPAMIMNFAANMLGLGNSATPLGLKAMEHLQEINPHKSTASNSMVTFLALNTAAFTLVPMTAINYLAAAGIRNAYEIIVPTILATICTTITAIVVAKSLQNLRWFQQKETVATPANAPEAAASEIEPSNAISSRGRLFLIALGIAFVGITLLELSDSSVRSQVLDSTGISHVLQSAEQRAADAKAAAVTPAPSDPAAAPGLDLRARLNSASALAIPLLILITLSIALARRVKVYEEFVEGAKEGFSVATRIMPFLVAMFVALAIFRFSGALLLLEYVLAPAMNAIGFPVDLLPMALMRPLSGSGSLGVLNEILMRPDASEFLKFTAAIMFGSTETTFYVLAVYFGSVGVKNIRHALIAGLTADAMGLMMSVVIGRLMFAA
jgi:spore maturation protein SpmA